MEPGEQLTQQTFWPNTDAFAPHVHTSGCACGRPKRLTLTSDPLPSDHQFTRACPRCTQTLAKRTAEDLFACNRGGWREWREAPPRRRWT
jgi:hypothetical protein